MVTQTEFLKRQQIQAIQRQSSFQKKGILQKKKIIAKEKKEQVKKQVKRQELIDETISKLKKGDIKSLGDIPKEIKSDIKIPKDYWKKLLEYQKQKADYESKKAKQKEYQTGYKFGLKGVVNPNFTEEEKKGYRAARSEIRFSKERIKGLKEPQGTYIDLQTGLGYSSAFPKQPSKGYYTDLQTGLGYSSAFPEKLSKQIKSPLIESQKIKQVPQDFRNVFDTSSISKDIKAHRTLVSAKNGRSTIKGFEKPREYFEPRIGFTGAFVSASPTGEGATGQIRQPTKEEAERIKKSQESIMTSSPYLLQQEIDIYKKLTGDIEGLTGSDLDIRIKKLKSTGAEVKEINEEITIFPRKIKVGFGGATRDKPITDFDKATLSGVVKESFATTLGVGLSEGSKKLGLTEKGITSFDMDIKTYESQFGTAQFNPLTGEYISVKKKTSKEKFKILTPSQLEKAGKTAGEFGVYAVPYLGSSIYFSDVGEKVIKSSSAVKFVKENPTDAFILATLGTTKAFKGITKPVISTKALEVSKVKPFAIVSKPKSLVMQQGIITTERDITGFSQVARQGQKTIVSTRIRKLFGLKPKYSGNPYVEDEAYTEALNFLQSRGMTELKARNVLRLKKPKLDREIFKGKVVTQQGNEFSRVILSGEERIVPKKFEVGGVKAISGEGKIKYIFAVGKPKGELFEVGKKIKTSFLSKEGIPYSKVRQAGKTTETYLGFSKSEKLGEGAIPIKSFGNVILGKPVEIFKEKGISKRLIPKMRRLETSKTKVFIEKGKPDVEFNIDEILGTTRKGTQVAKQEQQLSKDIASTILSTKKIKQIPVTRQKLGLTKTIWKKPLVKELSLAKQGGLIKQEQSLFQKPKTDLLKKQKVIQIQIQKQRPRQTQSLYYLGKKLESEKEIIKIDIKPKQIYKPIVREFTGTDLLTTGIITPISIDKKIKIKPPKITTPIFPIKSLWGDDIFKKKKIAKGYDVYAKERGKNIRLNKNPITRLQALNLGSEVVDKTLSARFFLRKTKKKPINPSLRIPQRYFGFNSNKFRDYRVVKGKKKLMKNTYIENASFRLDTNSEVKRITAARYLSQKRKEAENIKMTNKNLNKMFFPTMVKRSKKQRPIGFNLL